MSTEEEKQHIEHPCNKCPKIFTCEDLDCEKWKKYVDGINEHFIIQVSIQSNGDGSSMEC